MRLLFDQNLSRALVRLLNDLFPNSIHVSAVSLERSGDLTIWEFAGREGLMVVTKDEDFVGLARRLGAPPKVIHIATGNCPTLVISELLRSHCELIIAFAKTTESVLVLRLD